MRSWVGYLAVDRWLPAPETEQGEGSQVLTYGVKADPARRALAFWSMAFYVLLSFMASLVAHCSANRVAFSLCAAASLGRGMAVSIKVVRDEGPMVIMLRSSGHAFCILLGKWRFRIFIACRTGRS